MPFKLADSLVALANCAIKSKLLFVLYVIRNFEGHLFNFWLIGKIRNLIFDFSDSCLNEMNETFLFVRSIGLIFSKFSILVVF